ncbi:MAG: glycosyltransferase family 39 protein [Deltaproteobacteria bacterium]|nr:glycosyltransferase family 39 protein [Deltaproteobacteria bacterium]
MTRDKGLDLQNTTGALRGKLELLILSAIGFFFLFWEIGLLGLLDPNEGLYGSIAREMAESGDWITPRFNGVRYLEKPPLYFWLTALTIKIFGPSEFSVRVWSAIPALGTMFLSWRLGRLLYGGKAGLASAIIYATSVGVFRYVRVAGPDFLLVFANTLAVYGFLISCQSNRSRPAGGEPVRARPSRFLGSLLFYLGMGLGVLAKGLIGILFPVAVMILFLAVEPLLQQADGARTSWGPARARLSRIIRPFLSNPIGPVILVLLLLPWHLLAAWENPGFFDFYILDNQILRFISLRGFVEDDVPLTTLAFLGVTGVWLFPWSLFLAPAIRYGVPRQGSADDERLHLIVGLWALVVIAFFALSSSKLEHYFLPAVPPLSLMFGALWANAWMSNPSAAGFRRSFGAGALGSLVIGMALLLYSDSLTPRQILRGLAELNVYYRALLARGAEFPYGSIAPIIGLLKGLGWSLVGGVPLAFLLFQFHMPKASFVVLVSMAGILGWLVFKLLLIVEPYHSTKAEASVLVAHAKPGDPIVHDGPLEYSGGLPYYTGQRIFVLDGRRGDLEFGSRYQETRHLFLDPEAFARLWNSNRRVFLVTRFVDRETVTEKIQGLEFFPLGRFGSRRLYSNGK